MAWYFWAGILPSQLYAETPMQALQEPIGLFQSISHEAGQVRMGDESRSWGLCRWTVEEKGGKVRWREWWR
jgi:hypothetical protein